jgi:Asp-tRNA(Asn)/Glu-tRNA(Gln) amidotransferase B subunit
MQPWIATERTLLQCVWEIVLMLCLQEARISFAELQLAPATLAGMISLIEAGAISGKIGKQILPDLLEVCAATS